MRTNLLLGRLGRLKPAAPPAGGTVTYDTSIDISVEDSTTLDTAAMTITGSASRFLLAGMLSRDFGTPATHSSMSQDSGTTALTQLGTTQAVGAQRVSCWRLIAPVSGSKNVRGVLSDQDSVHYITAGNYYNVHQTTPINNTPTRVTGSGTNPAATSITITGTTVSGGKLLGILAIENLGAADITVASGDSGATVIRQSEYLIQGKLCFLEKDNTAGSTQLSVTITATGDCEWSLDAFAIQPP